MNMISSSASVSAARPLPGPAPLNIRVDIADPALAARVRRALSQSGLLADSDDAEALVLSAPAAPAHAAEWSADRPRLSQREQEVAGLLLEGASNKVIARELDISVHTAKFHVTQILDKLGARNRADAVSMILREGLVVL
jgi:DNA-binding NarL/FixJ family response regulator